MRDNAVTPIRGSKRSDERYTTACEIELRMGSWLAIRVHTRNISRGGSCVRLPGGARCGERYRVVVSPSDPNAFDLAAEVRWVGELDASGFALVGVRWLLANDGAATRLDTLLAACH